MRHSSISFVTTGRYERQLSNRFPCSVRFRRTGIWITGWTSRPGNEHRDGRRFRWPAGRRCCSEIRSDGTGRLVENLSRSPVSPWRRPKAHHPSGCGRGVSGDARRGISFRTGSVRTSGGTEDRRRSCAWSIAGCLRVLSQNDSAQSLPNPHTIAAIRNSSSSADQSSARPAGPPSIFNSYQETPPDYLSIRGVGRMA